MREVPLPRGRHDLPREVVERSQRERIRRATIEQVAEVGFHKATIAAIVTHAGVSRQTFYEMYDGKVEAYWDAYAGVAATLLDVTGSEMAVGTADAMTRLRAGLEAYLAWLAADPVVTRCFILERPGRSGQITEIEEQVAAAGELSLAALFPAVTAFDRRAYTAILDACIRSCIIAGETERLPDLVDPIMRIAERILVGQPITV